MKKKNSLLFQIYCFSLTFILNILTKIVRNSIGRFRGLGPTIVVCPATLMEQWVKHFHEWWPFFRVVVLHHSGGYNGNKKNISR